jgi:hypothetical protein
MTEAQAAIDDSMIWPTMRGQVEKSKVDDSPPDTAKRAAMMIWKRVRVRPAPVPQPTDRDRDQYGNSVWKPQNPDYRAEIRKASLRSSSAQAIPDQITVRDEFSSSITQAESRRHRCRGRGGNGRIAAERESSTVSAAREDRSG